MYLFLGKHSFTIESYMTEHDAPLLCVNHLTKKFVSYPSIYSFKNRIITVVDDLSFTLKKGEIVGLLGKNGAGKTTTISMLLGTLRPTSGSITYFGKELEKNRSELLQHIAFASSSVQLPALLTVYHNLDIYGRLYGLSKEERSKKINELLEIFRISHLQHLQVGDLSSGEVTRVLLAKAFLASPKIVLLDEATSALDPEIARHVRNYLRTQRRENGTAILLASHNMAEVAEMCDRVLVLDQGKIIAQDTPAGLIKQIPTVRVQFIPGESMPVMKQYFDTCSLAYSSNAGALELTLDENAIAPLLQNFAQKNISYSHVSIAKPTLEEYFLKNNSAVTCVTHEGAL